MNKIDIPENLDWEIFRRFNIVVNSSNFAEAAKRVGTSHGALLKQLNFLEEQLNIKLFIRTGKHRTLNLTPEGEALKTITEQIDNILHNKIFKKLSKKNLEEVHYLKIITTAGLSTTLLPSIIEDFLKSTKKNISLELVTHSVPNKINTGEIILRHDFLNQTHFKLKKLMTLNLFFYASQPYIDTYGLPNSNGDLENHKILAVKYFKISSLDKILNRTEHLYSEAGIQSDYISFLIEMALKNFGIIELPDIHPAVKYLVKIPTLNSTKIKIFAGFLDVADQKEIVRDFINYLDIKILNN